MRARLLLWLKKLGDLEPGPGAVRDLRPPRWLTASALGFATLVLSVELFVRVEQRPLLELVVTLADACLAVSFGAWLAVQFAREQGRLADKLSSHRADLAVALISVALIFAVTARVSGPIVIGRLLFVTLGRVLSTPAGERVARIATKNPSRTTALSFAGLIALGTLLLMTPAATTSGKGTPLVDAFFTITSAVCVTGLAVQDTGAYFTPFGQTVILLGVQIGAIGIMVLGAAFIVIVGGSLPQRRQVGLSEMLEVRAGLTLRRLIGAVTATTLAAELLGILSLYLLWTVGGMELPKRYDDAGGALWWCAFHAISAFCNAGFGLASDNLSSFVANPFVCGIIALLITTGGLGFAVMSDLTSRRLPWLRRPRWSWDRLQLQTRVVLLATVVLNVVGTIGILFFEFAGALAPYDLGVKINAALFHAVSLRTAGFNTIPLGALAGPTIIMMLLWMFIGGGPGSTAGGIKTTTAVTVFFAVRAMIRARDDVEVFGRTLPKNIVYRAISIVMLAGALLVVFVVALTATQSGVRLEHLLFEAVSAMGTVGLTLDTTTRLDETGRVLVALLMFCGRLGPLTVALAVGERALAHGIQYPEGRMAVG